MKLERTKNSLKGMATGVINKIILLILPFIVRTIFINTLGIEYLGLNSLFTSILNILNLAELGIGSAIVFSLYSAVAKNDKNEICCLMNFYKKIYRVIGCAVFVIGLLFIPFLNIFCKADIPPDINIYILYLMYLINTSSSYFLFAYKNSILMAYQQNYIINNVNTCIKVLLYIVQGIFLLLGKGYYLYVIFLIVATILENIVNALIVTKRYPEFKAEGDISKEEKNKIYKKVKALFLYKVGGVVLGSVDSVVISTFLGLAVLGKYNNYYYIITTLFGFFQVYSSSLTAGVGNSIISESVGKNKKDFDILNFINMWIVGWCSICLVCLYQDFIELWVGKEYLFSIGIVILLAIYFYVWKILEINNVYKEAAGLWEFDKYRPIVASIVNLAINIVLVKTIGIYGIIISTIISIVAIIFPWSTFVLFREYFKGGYKKYIFKNILNIIITFIVGCITFCICSLMKNISIFTLITKGIICLIIPNILYLICYFNNNDFKETVKWTEEKFKIGKKLNTIKKYLTKVIIGLIIICIILLLIITLRIKYLFKDINYVNFSIDDTIDFFEDITVNQYESIFQNEFLGKLKKYHDKYNTNFTLYCFYENNKSFTLKQCTHKYKDEFRKNSDWLKFGFHAYNSNSDYSTDYENISKDYNDVISELIKISSEENITTTIRLEKFLGNKKNINKLITNGVTGLLGADTNNRIDYFLDETQNNELFEKDILQFDDIKIYNTDMRIEKWNLVNKMEIQGDNLLVVFTHEWALNHKRNVIKTDILLQILKHRNVRNLVFIS